MPGWYCSADLVWRCLPGVLTVAWEQVPCHVPRSVDDGVAPSIGNVKRVRGGVTLAAEPPDQRQPVINAPTSVLVLIATLVVVHAVRDYLPFDEARLGLIYLAFIPARLTEIGAGLPGGQLIGLTSMVSHAFLHADWIHLTVNGAWLLAFGSLIARRSGALRFFALFLASAVAGAALFFLVNSNELAPLVGASGGISGLMGAAFRVLFAAFDVGGIRVLQEYPNLVPRMPLQVALVDRRTMSAVAIWLGVNLVFGLGLSDMFQSGEIAWEAHVGGFLFGFLMFRWFDGGPGYRAFRDIYPEADI